MTSDTFENLSKSIVEYLFRDTFVKISPTRATKDGGYDIEVEYKYVNSVQKAYFECKLRNKNLSIRDIAANVIIAYNHGAIAMIAITNHDFTQQTGDELLSFNQKTILNIKIIGGQDIQQIVTESGIHIPKELSKYFNFKKNHRKKDFPILQLNLEQNIPFQIFEQTDNHCAQQTDLFLQKAFFQEMSNILNSIQQGQLIIVNGYLGVGKHEIIQNSIRMSKRHPISLDATFYDTKELIVLDLLSQIWGIPEIEIIESFSQDNIAAITEMIGDAENNKDTIAILTSLMNKDIEGKRATAQQNVLLSQYILNLLNLHINNICYVFYIRKLQYANKEIFDFLTFLVKYLTKQSIACIISHQDPEYQLQEGKNILENLCHIDRYIEYDIKPLKAEMAEEYIKQSYPGISLHMSKLIVSKIGTRFYNLASLLKAILPEGITLPTDSKSHLQKLDMFSQNSIDNQINFVLLQYQDQIPSLLQTAFIFNCRIPFEIISLLNLSFQVLETIEKVGLFYYERNFVLAKNDFVKVWIQHNYSVSSIAIRTRAKELLDQLESLRKPYNTQRILLFRIVEEWNDALKLINSDLILLKRTKQYTALREELITAIDISIRLHDKNKEAQYLVEYLEIITIQKDITSNEANMRIDQLEKCIAYLPHSHISTYALIYFQLKRAFKLGNYLKDNDKAIELGKGYYEKCVQNVLTDNCGDWLGKICCCYALFVKSLKGNEAALEIFNNAIKLFPKSFELQREYKSHIACMQLYENPLSAFSLYQKIVDMFDNEAPDSAALPFHEYGDLAMSQLLAHNFLDALLFSNNAIDICQSNGIYDEEGRNINIRGCIYWCLGDLSKAEEDFSEATSIMCQSEYVNYAWRSQLNLLLVSQRTKTYSNYQTQMLEKFYSDFKYLLSSKINVLAKNDFITFQKTREYHALLAIGYLWEKIKLINDGSKIICNDFNIGNHSKHYQTDLNSMRFGNIHFINSPYIQNDFIFFVG